MPEFSPLPSVPNDQPSAGPSVYRHIRYDEVVSYEFLLPLTREDKLRRALDALFYSDTIEQRLRAIGLERVAEIVPRPPGLSDDAYVALVLGVVADRFVGYSISLVNGRYRATGLMSRHEAGDFLARDGRYLIDETTAVVRFIIKCDTTRAGYDPDHQPIRPALDGAPAPVASVRAALEEAHMVRALFFELFAEAVVHMVEGEDEIWLLENGAERRLYVWERVRTYG
jgi:hypothetical protein